MKKSILTLAIVAAFTANAFADHNAEHKATEAKAAATQKATEVKADAKAAATTTKTTATEVKAEMQLPAGVTPEQMAETMKLTQPSDAHKKLDAFVGNWTYTGKFWMDAKQKKPEMMKGTSENTWILGGRFLQAKATGEATKDWPAFEGLGLTGYDNVKKQYTSSWMDNMSTGTMTATASFDDKSKTFSENGTYSCPMEKGEKKYRSVWKIKGKDAYQYVSYMQDATGKEFKAIEIDYKRTK